jgi:hypothetical protein
MNFATKPRHYTELRPQRAEAMVKEIAEIEQAEQNAAAAQQRRQREEARELQRGSIAGLRAEFHAEIAAVRQHIDSAFEGQSDAIAEAIGRLADDINEIEHKFDRRLNKIEATVQVLERHGASTIDRAVADLRRQINGERVQQVKDIIAAVLATCGEVIDERCAAIEQRRDQRCTAIEVRMQTIERNGPAASVRALDELRARHAAEIADVEHRCLAYFDQRLSEIERRAERERDVYAMIIKQALDSGVCIKMPKLCGTYKQDGRYVALDVIALNGNSFIARYDNPGPCPGDGWQLFAQKGSKGAPGEKGERGYSGTPALSPAQITSWQTNRSQFTIVPRLSDGTCGPELDLRGLFEQFASETT